VDNRGDNGDVEDVVSAHRSMVEEETTELVLLGLSSLVVLSEGGINHVLGDLRVLDELRDVVEALHEAAADVVLAMPLDLLGGAAVEDEAAVKNDETTSVMVKGEAR